MPPKVLFQLYINVSQHKYISQKAEKSGRSRAAIVRDIIEKHRKEEAEEAKKAEMEAAAREEANRRLANRLADEKEQ